MIGQKALRERIATLISDNNFPRFSIFVGEQGSGRKTLISTFVKHIGLCQMCDVGVDTVRDVIEQSYKIVEPTVFLFADADSMSVGAKNALLKVTEEPPNNVYFIMTLMSEENTLATIRSRATVFHMDAYTRDELMSYYSSKWHGDENVVQTYCQTIGEIELLMGAGADKLNEFVLKVADNVEKVSGANAFKIGQSLNLGSGDKADPTKFDLALFWKAFRTECVNRLSDIPLKYIAGVNITSKYLYDLRTVGVNKQMCFDNWLLDIRKEWMQYADN